MTSSTSKPPGFLQISAWVIYGIYTAAFLVTSAVSQTSPWHYWISLPYIGLVWVIFSAGVVYHGLTQTYSHRHARKPFYIAWIGSFVIGFISQVAFPITVNFEQAMGTRLAGVSLSWLCLWVVNVFGGRELLALMFARVTRLQMAMTTATLTTFALINLQQIAFVRGWWNFQGLECTNGMFWYVLWAFWWIGAFGIAFTFKEPVIQREGNRWKAVMVFVVLHLAALLTRIAQG